MHTALVCSIVVQAVHMLGFALRMYGTSGCSDSIMCKHMPQVVPKTTLEHMLARLRAAQVVGTLLKSVANVLRKG